MARVKTTIAEILYEDNHLIAVNKPFGIPVQPDISGDECLLDYVKEFIKVEYNKPGDVFLGLIHRLDRPVSGVVVFAKTSKALSRMNELFKTRDVVKTYWALTKEKTETEHGILSHYLLKDEKNNKSKAYDKEVKGSKLAVLEYMLKSRIGEKLLLEVKLHSGRHHQIRVQLAKGGLTIIGDVKYGYSRPNKDKSICLHARRLEFIHPVKKEKVVIEAPLPKSPFWQDFNNLK